MNITRLSRADAERFARVLITCMETGVALTPDELEDLAEICPEIRPNIRKEMRYES
jgi:hypothetical protein